MIAGRRVRIPHEQTECLGKLETDAVQCGTEITHGAVTSTFWHPVNAETSDSRVEELNREDSLREYPFQLVENL